MKSYQLEATPGADLDVEGYEAEGRGLGAEFLNELRITYERILDFPLGYGIRRALTRRFPYAIFFQSNRKPS